MEKVEIELEPGLAEEVRQAAFQLGLTAEDFLHLSLKSKLAEMQRDFEAAAHYVLTKNTELYHRLA